MRGKVRHSSPKPKVAYANHDAAVANIATKRDALTNLAEQAAKAIAQGKVREVEAAQRLVKLLPASVRQFNAWSSAHLPDSWSNDQIAFRVSANQTLLKSGLLESVKLAVNVAKAVREHPSNDASKRETIAGLQRELKLAVQLRLIAEREILRLKGELRDSKGREASLQAQLGAANREGARLATERQSTTSKVAPSNVLKLPTSPIVRGKRNKESEP